MLADAVDLPAAPERVDVLIIGAGPAGITIARSLARLGIESTVVEAGGETPGIGEDLFTGTTDPEYPLIGSRLSGLGGTSGHWAGLCRPIDATVFDGRPWVPDASWPIASAQIAAYYRQAAEIVEIGDLDAEPFDPGEPITGHFASLRYRYSPPTRFADRYGAELRSSDVIRVFVNARVLRLHAPTENSSVDSVDVLDSSGRIVPIAARRVVLALGGIESPRLLLVSNDTRPAGLGNEHDVVGRYFAEHPMLADLPFIGLRAAADLAELGMHSAQVPGWRGHLTPTLPAQAEHELLSSFALVAQPGIEGLEYLYESASRLPAPPISALLAPMSTPEIPDEAAARLQVGRVTFVFEQTPNPESRVLVDRGNLDEAGVPRVSVQLRFTDHDRQSAERTVRLLAADLGQSGIGRLQIPVGDVLERSLGEGVVACHHMGSVRAGNDPARSVVDANLKIHSLANVWVCGSAVFPGTGSENPTLTIVALALRLAEHLGSQ